MMMSATSIPRMMVHAGHHTLGVRLSLVGPVGQSVSWVYASVFMEMSVWLTRRDRWSVGSMLFLASWAFLMGPYQYAIHLMSGARLPFTAAYFGSIVMTIYFAVGLHSTILTLFSSIVQLVALVWYLVSYFPMGSTGLRFAARIGGGRVAAWVCFPLTKDCAI